MPRYPEYKQISYPTIARDIRAYWEQEKIFEKSVENRRSAPQFVFFEGPPSANGTPGIHHVIARTIKDLFCRFRTMKGNCVPRKGGWDTHGLPVEMSVEKALGITKEDIGKKISVADYNAACRSDVMKYTDIWLELTQRMGYWVDMQDPYITYDNKYIESVWYLLGELFKKDLLYQGYSIQPYSPAAGTGLSTHELNQPGCYKQVKDTSIVAQFKIAPAAAQNGGGYTPGADEEFFLAWTTTPWTLPSNTALAVGKNITYVRVKTFNPYTFAPVTVILAREVRAKYFPDELAAADLSGYKPGDPKIPYTVLGEITGAALNGTRYEQLMPYAQPAEGDAFRVVLGDFVSTEDGTGIVHIAPSFGEDDFRVARQNGIGALTLVDLQGRFAAEVTDYAGQYVKEQYEDPAKLPKDFKPVDVRIAIKLKEENRAFKVEKYEHSYPHCWRTDKPILYYPLNAWFIRTSAYRDRMVELNRTIQWKPESTGTGRFGNWLENMVDWNVSRSRYWGIPLPIWTSEDGTERLCISSLEELKAEADNAVKAGVMTSNPLQMFQPGNMSAQNYTQFDLHRPYVDEIVLVSPSGKPMRREAELIDVWFDSGAMPYAQFHYPFENRELVDSRRFYPADFIAEGVDQTRGWFYTLHALGVMLFDSVAYKAVVSNGLVLDKNGNKMSKRLGNVVDPDEVLDKHGPDALRWYLITNAPPWDNIKFDQEGPVEANRKFLSKLANTYAFFALYANIDSFSYAEPEIPLAERPEIDRWILSRLHSLIAVCDAQFSDYEPTRAARAIEEFVDEHLSNWYVRLCRRRFWKGEYGADKISAYQTLFQCLECVCRLAAPVAPFYTDRLYLDLTAATGRDGGASVHLADFPVSDQAMIDTALEERMEIAQRLSSLVLSLRTKQNLKVRQPLGRIMVPVLDDAFKAKVEAVRPLVLAEVNVKEIEYVSDAAGVITKSIKPNFRTLGKKVGKHMKVVGTALQSLTQPEISAFERSGSHTISVEGESLAIELADVEIVSSDIPGWLVASIGNLTVALDITVTPELWEEGIARELVNRVQNLRKESGFDVTDRIKLSIEGADKLESVLKNNRGYICSETLATELEVVREVPKEQGVVFELDDDISARVCIAKVV